MSEETTQTVETTTETPQTTAPETAASPEAQASPGEMPAVPQAPAYTPNFKFRAYEKEHEIDEMFRPLIKDADTEKKVKSIFEKAYGLDDMKPKYQKVRGEFDEYKKKNEPILNSVNTLQQMLNKGDVDNFFKALNIPDNLLYKHVLNKLNYKDMTPEQRQEYDQNVAARQQALLMEQQNQQFQQQFEQMANQNRMFELNQVLERPETKAIVTAYENAHGPGSFKTAIIDYGANVWKAQGRDLTAEQAVGELSKFLTPFVSMQQPQAPAPQAEQRPPVIPNISGRSSSPVKQVPKSISDLKKMADQLNAG